MLFEFEEQTQMWLGMRLGSRPRPWLDWLGWILLGVGALLGWLLPQLANRHVLWIREISSHIPAVTLIYQRLDGNVDLSAFLGADLTALAVIIAILIGFNTAALQVAGSAYSPTLVRAILLSLMPMLGTWALTSLVTLVYLVFPPKYLGEVWQEILWFCAVIALMIGYLWQLPWRLSGGFAAMWALRELRESPIERWEMLDGYIVLQTSAVTASNRGDLGGVRALLMAVGGFLASQRDMAAERANQFDRARYRALKNLLSGCAQRAGSAPNAVSYYLGFLAAGVLVQAVAIGLPMNLSEHNLFSGVFKALRDAPDLSDPLWTGVRHGLCRSGLHGSPYLIRYWCKHKDWTADDMRLYRAPARALVSLHTQCRNTLSVGGHTKHRAAHTDVTTAETSTETAAIKDLESITDDVANMIVDLYRDIALYLGPAVVNHGHSCRSDTVALPGKLMDAVHADAHEMWLTGSDRSWAAVEEAYLRFRGKLTK